MIRLKYRLSLLIFLLGITVSAQNIYKSGFYILNNGKRVNCLIKESDLKNTPESFNYKLSASSYTHRLVVDSVKDVQITDGIRYKWVDISVNNLQSDRLFLNVLVSGKGSLYKYDNGKSVEYYFQIKDSTALYLPPPENGNKQPEFITILKNNLSCNDLIDADYSGLTYSDGKLMTLFIRYNVCQQSGYVNIRNKKEYDFFNLYIKPGFSYQSLQVVYMREDMPFSIHFGHKPTWRFGLEAEFNMNIINNRTALIIDPSFNYFQAEKVENSIYSNVHYTSVEIPLGIRQYLTLSPKSELFADVAYLVDFGFNSDIEYRDIFGNVEPYDLNNAIYSYYFGIGYCWNTKFNVELRYNFQKELFPREVYWQTDLSGFSVILGYNLFK
ncbi:hypothetical protein [Saccharicrinis sp. FJH54]|uniref:hypothetical protein n=1 Tax=Saccharicrinis sp. FJH54 TaxID=3344665 RepID=UPI0035D41E25